jgi:nicotinate-nucleotide--dimethylbenzimidazole phosphoribosyltransferase
MALLDETLRAIEPVDERAGSAAQRHLDSLTKPLGSLGYLEELVRRYAAIRHDRQALTGTSVIAVFVADHGIADEGVSAYPQAVSAEMLRNIAYGGAAVSTLARQFGYTLIVTDVGVATDTSAEPLPGVRYHRLAAGTANFLRGPAMSIEQTRRALEIGIEVARESVSAGATLIGIGEMGIGNSTTAAALLSSLSGIEPARLAGRGTGVDDLAFRRKLEVIEAGLGLHRAACNDGMASLAAFGGFEIAAMAGVCLGGAAARVPIVIDGFIATAAAVAAGHLYPGLYNHLFFGHRSAEGGHALVLERIGVRPILDLDIRLGEGVGAVLAMRVIESALGLFHRMATFASAGVSGRKR